MSIKYAILSVAVAIAIGFGLSWFINDHFEDYEKKCVSVSILYEAGRKTEKTRTEVPCP